MNKTVWVALFVLAPGCATSFVVNQPSHVMLANTYDPVQVRDAIATVVTKRRMGAQEGGGVIQVVDKRGCSHTIVYSERSVDITSAGAVTPEQAAQNLIDEECLDTAAHLGKWIVKQVERPAKLAAKEERRQRRAEATATALGVLGGVAQAAGAVGGAAAPMAMGGGAPAGRSVGTRSVSVNSKSNVSVTRNGSTTTMNRQYSGTRVETRN